MEKMDLTTAGKKISHAFYYNCEISQQIQRDDITL